MSRISVFAILAAAGAASAQSAAGILGDLSTSCQQAAAGLISSPFAQCADMTDLISVVSTQDSIVDPLNKWAGNLCKQSPCDDSTVQAASSSINTNCSSDISGGNIAAVVLQTITTNFNDVKSLVCLQSTDNSTSCLINFLTNVQTATGTQLTIDNLEKMATASQLEQLLGQLPQGDICTDCNAAVLNQLSNSNVLNQSEVDQLKQAAQGECGSSFGTSMPSDVKEASSGARSAVALGAAALAGLAFAF